MPGEANHVPYGAHGGDRGIRLSQETNKQFFPSIIALAVFLASLLAFVFFFVLGGGAARAADKRVAWKPIQEALLRVDDQPVKNWNVYEESKKGDPLLLAMGNRFLLIEIHDRKIFELVPARIQRKGAELVWDSAERPAEALATAGWVIRDVGFAYRIGFRLEAEKHAFDVQLPHPMDLRYIY